MPIPTPDGRARAPDRQVALAQYRARAAVYDLELALLEPVRRRAVAALALEPGQTVFDVGCGTGLSLAPLRAGVGPRGRIVGIEQSPEMLGRARERVRRQRWRNVTLLCAPAEDAHLSRVADAALFHFTHDVLQRPEAIANVLAHLRPGARVVATGLKWAGPLRWPINLLVLPAALRSVSSLQGLAAPWAGLAGSLDDFEVTSLLLGGAFLARGRNPAGRASAPSLRGSAPRRR